MLAIGHLFCSSVLQVEGVLGGTGMRRSRKEVVDLEKEDVNLNT